MTYGGYQIRLRDANPFKDEFPNPLSEIGILNTELRPLISFIYQETTNKLLHIQPEKDGNNARQSEIGWTISWNYYPVE